MRGGYRGNRGARADLSCSVGTRVRDAYARPVQAQRFHTTADSYDRAERAAERVR